MLSEREHWPSFNKRPSFKEKKENDLKVVQNIPSSRRNMSHIALVWILKNLSLCLPKIFKLVSVLPDSESRQKYVVKTMIWLNQ